MRVMIDTNIIISAALFPHGRVAQALYKALNAPYEPVLCEYVLDELHRKFQEKFPDKQVEMEAFLFTLQNNVEIVDTPDEVVEEEKKIRDVKDRPILRAALNSDIDYFLTGDKDFLESEVTDLRIISVNEFLCL